jgi:hypothetical protein
MRTLFILLLALLTGAATVHANGPPPGKRYLNPSVILHAPITPDDWVYFISVRGESERVTFGPDGTFAVASPWAPPNASAEYNLMPPTTDVVVWAVRPDKSPDGTGEWNRGVLEDLVKKGVALRSEPAELDHRPVSHLDLQDGSERHFRLERTETEIRLHSLGDQTRWHGTSLVVWGACASAGVFLLGWVVRLVWNKRRVTRTAPPPGN